MLDALEKFQRLAVHFQPQLLIVPGLLLVLAGLCVWLAGLRWRKLIAAVVVALLVGGIIKNFTGYSFAIIAAVSVVFAIIAAAIEKTAMGVLAILLVVFITLFFFAWPGIAYDETTTADSDPNSAVLWPEYDIAEEVILAPKAVEITASYFKSFANEIGNSFAKLTSFNFALAGFAAILVIVMTLILPNTMMALTCAFIGAILIADGMFLLLLYKGSEPVAIVSQNPVIYATVLAAMVAFGAVVQILLGAPLRKSTTTQKKDNDNGETK